MKKLLIAGLVLVALVASACSAAPATPTTAPTLVPTRPLPTATTAPTNTPTPAPTSTPTAVPTPANPVQGLLTAFKGLGGVKSFRAKISTTGLPGGTQDSDLEMVLPDRFHMTTSKLEMILIGKTMYIKTGTKWQKLTQNIDLSAVDAKKLEAELGISKDVKLVGTDVIDGTPTFVYQYTTTIKGPPARTTTSKVWVGMADNLPRKRETEPKAGQKTTTTYYDYNANITINAPM